MSVHQSHELSADRQAEARAAETPCNRLVTLLKMVEDPGLGGGLDANAAVLDSESHALGTHPLYAEADVTLVGELDRVAQEVGCGGNTVADFKQSVLVRRLRLLPRRAFASTSHRLVETSVRPLSSRLERSPRRQGPGGRRDTADRPRVLWPRARLTFAGERSNRTCRPVADWPGRARRRHPTSCAATGDETSPAVANTASATPQFSTLRICPPDKNY